MNYQNAKGVSTCVKNLKIPSPSFDYIPVQMKFMLTSSLIVESKVLCYHFQYLFLVKTLCPCRLNFVNAVIIFLHADLLMTYIRRQIYPCLL